MAGGVSWTIGDVPSVTAAGWVHLVLFGLVVPVLALLSRRHLMMPGAPLPPRRRFFASTALTLAAFAAVSWAVAAVEGLPLLPALRVSLPAAVAIGLLVYVVAVVLGLPWWRRAVFERRRFVDLVMPENAPERAWWIALSCIAGVSEELTWRGVQTTLLAAWLGSGILASLACALSFGIAHATQGARSAAAITAFALVFQAVVGVTGSLVVAMVVHAAYDMTAGLTYAHLGRVRAEAEAAARGRGQPASTVSGTAAGGADAAGGGGGADRSPSSSN